VTARDTELAALADGIIWTLKKATEGGHFNERRYRLIRDELISANDAEYLVGVQALASRLAAEGAKGQELLTGIMNYAEFGDRQTMSLIIAHHDDLIIKPVLILMVTSLTRGLLNKGITAIGVDGRVSTLHAHFKAKGHYDQQINKIYGLEDLPEQIETYRGNTVYATAVERHADKIDKLLAYRDLRGITMDRDERDGYDEEDFLQYLAHGAVGSGWL
jgi:hypothetical protein